MSHWHFFFQVSSSTATSVLLDRVSLASDGAVLQCEVTVTPGYSTRSGSARLRVVRHPKTKVPSVEVIAQDGSRLEKAKRFQVGEVLNINCTSVGGYPPPTLNWYINGLEVKIQV